MLFTRTYKYRSMVSSRDIKSRLLGDQLKVHDLDFEVTEKENTLRIVPSTPSLPDIKKLPVTHVQLTDKGSKTQIVIKAKMRRPGAAGPILVVTFCGLLFIAAILFFVFGREEYASVAYTCTSIGLLAFIIFWVRLETGYFDYIRKVRDFVRNAGKL